MCRPNRVSQSWRCADHQPPVAYFPPAKPPRQRRSPSTSHLFSSTRPRRRIVKKYGLQFHPPGTTEASGNCLLLPPAGELLKQNSDKIGRSIHVVLKVVSAPARFWERGARCFAVRLCALEQVDETAVFFLGSIIRDSKAFKESSTSIIFIPYV